MESCLTVTQGAFILQRLPQRANELLRAWDAADEYLLEHVAGITMTSATRLLIMNDTFGALAVALNAWQPTALSDSYLSQQATRINLLGNQLPERQVTLLSSLEPMAGFFDIVLIKVPKTLALLEDELLRLRAHLKPSTIIVLAGMLKTMPASVWSIIERLLGPTTTSLAKKKARLIFVTFNPDLPAPTNPYPVCYQLEDSDYLISNHANVFSRDSLDIGTRFFIRHVPVLADAKDIIDLGCGNGVVGLLAAQANPAATLHFIDESFMAVASAKENFHRAFNDRQAVFRVGDSLIEFAAQSADVILCNPPFHQHNTIGDQIAVGMFKQAKRVLRAGGELRVIGNRHLGYQQQLKQLFGNCDLIAQNAKFVIMACRKN
ncbi:MAG: methyltransferase [Methylococcales bacterium]